MAFNPERWVTPEQVKLYFFKYNLYINYRTVKYHIRLGVSLYVT